MTTPRTRDLRVRPQIDAAIDYLSARGFIKVHEHPTQPASFDQNLHTILASCERGVCILRLDYGWLEEHAPADVARWLHDKQVAEGMAADADYDEVIVRGNGTLHLPRLRGPMP